MEPYLRSYLRKPQWPVAEFVIPSNVVIYDNLLGRGYVKGELPSNASVDLDDFEVVSKVGGTRKEDFIRWLSRHLRILGMVRFSK